MWIKKQCRYSEKWKAKVTKWKKVKKFVTLKLYWKINIYGYIDFFVIKNSKVTIFFIWW